MRERLSEEAAFGLKQEKLPRGDREEMCPKQRCSEGQSSERRGSKCARDLKGGRRQAAWRAWVLEQAGPEVRKGCMALLSVEGRKESS